MPVVNVLFDAKRSGTLHDSDIKDDRERRVKEVRKGERLWTEEVYKGTKEDPLMYVAEGPKTTVKYYKKSDGIHVFIIRDCCPKDIFNLNEVLEELEKKGIGYDDSCLNAIEKAFNTKLIDLLFDVTSDVKEKDPYFYDTYCDEAIVFEFIKNLIAGNAIARVGRKTCKLKDLKWD